MSAQLQSPSSSSEPQVPLSSAAPDASSTRSRTVGGIVLVIIGLLLLVAQLTDWNILGWRTFPRNGRHLPGLGLSHPQIRPDYPRRHLCRPRPRHVHPGRPAERGHGLDSSPVCF